MKNTNTSKLNIKMAIMVFVIASAMRMTYTGVGTLIPMIREEFGLSASAAGLISTIPTIVFALSCLLVPIISTKLGIGRTLELGLMLVAVGSILRAFIGIAGLYLGTVILAIGVGTLNVQMMGFIKLRFADRAGTATSIYTTTMALTAAISIGANVPIANAIGWRSTLAIWGICAAVSSVIWARQSVRPENYGTPSKKDTGLMLKMFKSKRAWPLLLFSGGQSMLFICIISWLPTILLSRGTDVSVAVTISTALQLISLPTTLLVPILVEKVSAIKLVGIFDACYVAGAILFFFSKGVVPVYIAVTLMALGVGSEFSFCNYLYVKKTRTTAETTALSGFSQLGGYIISSIGPVFMGSLFDLSGSWNAPMIFCFIVLIIMVVASLISNLPGYVLED